MLAVLTAALTSPVGAAPAPGPVRFDNLDGSPDEARLLQEVQDSLDRKRALDGKVDDLDHQLLGTQNDLRNAQNSLYAATVKQRNAEIRLGEIRFQLGGAERALRDYAIDAYTGRSDAGRLAALLFRAQDIGDLATRESYLRLASATQADLIVNRERLIDQMKDLTDELAAAADRADSERSRIAAQQSRLQSERDEQAAARRQISIEIANRDQALQEIADRRDEFEGQARELEAQSAAIADSLSMRASTNSSSSSSSSSPTDFVHPLSSLRISSPFGYRVHPIYGTLLLHAGTDFAATTGTAIKAANSGVVVSAGWLGGYGNATIIDHGGGIATLYGHQSQILVREGQQVTKGQVIGRVGCTGSCTGPHLHFEVRVNGNPVDPMPYL